MINLEGRRFHPTSQSCMILKQVAVGGSISGSTRWAEAEIEEKTNPGRLPKTLSYPQQPERWPKTRSDQSEELQTVRVLPQETDVDMGSFQNDDGFFLPISNTIDVVKFKKIKVTDAKNAEKEIQVPTISEVLKSTLS